MTIARVHYADSGQRANVATTNTYSLTITTPTSGNVLIMFVAVNTSINVTTPTGWTLSKTYNDTLQSYLFYRVADGSEGTAIALSAGANTHWVVAMGEYSGVDTSTPIASAAAEETGAGLTSVCPPGENTYLGSLHLNFDAVCDTGGDVTIDTPSTTNNPKSSTQINSTGGGISYVYHTNSLVSDGGKLWLAVWERILTSTDHSVTGISNVWGSSANKGVGIGVIVNPSGGTPVTAQAAGTGAAIFVQAGNNTWNTAATSVSVSLPSNNAVGNMLVLVACFVAGSAGSVTHTFSTPTGFTLYTGFPFDQGPLADDSLTHLRWYVWYKIATSITDDGLSLVMDAAGNAGGWTMVEFSGGVTATEQGMDNTESGTAAIALAAAFDSNAPAFHPSGNIDLSGGSLSIGVVEQFSNGAQTWSNSFTKRTTSTADAVPAVATRATSAPGRASSTVTVIKDGTGPDRAAGGFMIGFFTPSDNDKWGWGEGAEQWNLVIV